jgi:hypothetical protein
VCKKAVEDALEVLQDRMIVLFLLCWPWSARASDTSVIHAVAQAGERGFQGVLVVFVTLGSSGLAGVAVIAAGSIA